MIDYDDVADADDDTAAADDDDDDDADADDVDADADADDDSADHDADAFTFLLRILAGGGGGSSLKLTDFSKLTLGIRTFRHVFYEFMPTMNNSRKSMSALITYSDNPQWMRKTEVGVKRNKNLLFSFLIGILLLT